jgi:hypothetical protein
MQVHGERRVGKDQGNDAEFIHRQERVAWEAMIC